MQRAESTWKKSIEEAPRTKQIPFFILLDKNTSINEQLYQTIKLLNSQQFYFKQDIKGMDSLPDGAVVFYTANNESLVYKLQINDLRITEYHRNNGVTKLMYLETFSGLMRA